jgi:hypothetical protein
MVVDLDFSLGAVAENVLMSRIIEDIIHKDVSPWCIQLRTPTSSCIACLTAQLRSSFSKVRIETSAADMSRAISPPLTEAGSAVAPGAILDR